MIQYIVQPGDSLYTIGIRFKTSVSALMQANHISDPNMIYPGQVLKIPLPLSPTDGTGCLPDLRQGSSGPFVLLLQSQLARLGFYKGKLDGIFDPTTEGSVRQFQISRSLRPTGHADLHTWRHLLDDARGSQKAPPYHADMLLSGLFLILSADRPAYNPGQAVELALTKINLSSKPSVLITIPASATILRLPIPTAVPCGAGLMIKPLPRYWVRFLSRQAG